VTHPWGGSAPRTPGRTLRRRSTLLLAAGAWTIWVWATRIWNILGDPAHDAGFKAVHSLLALVSVAFGVALAVVGLRMRREERRPEIETAGARRVG
jgi:small neutral amino acid transporter SnatA (MarC family)